MPGLAIESYASDDPRLKSLAWPPTLTFTSASWTRLVYGALEGPRTHAWKMPLSQLEVVIVFHACVEVDWVGGVGLTVKAGGSDLAQPVRAGVVAYPPA